MNEILGCLSHKGYQNCIIDSKLGKFGWICGFCLLMELHRKGSARSLRSRFVCILCCNSECCIVVCITSMCVALLFCVFSLKVLIVHFENCVYCCNYSCDFKCFTIFCWAYLCRVLFLFPVCFVPRQRGRLVHTCKPWRFSPVLWKLDGVGTVNMGRRTFSQNLSSLAFTVWEWRFVEDIQSYEDDDVNQSVS